MGNCQAIDAATLVIQHPNGKVDKFYAPVSATHVMKTNPGHYVALLISSTTLCPTKHIQNCPNQSDHKANTNTNTNISNNNPVRLTRIKLLKPTDNLLLGQVYRLITTKEVMKGLREKQKAKMRQNVVESVHKPDLEKEKLPRRPDIEDNKVMAKPERGRARITAPTNNGGGATAKTRLWQPSLQSISESAS
ncbi:hypothetical protein LR48_Vigan04g052700 [Vigna angularis]|uniref:DUF4228 domain-containing protein n=2 Tax=Phaseolus angularis TaxID=3914 RepID=A0A0L9UCS5_PHAAN|nr:uncharacterized protein LOC108331085 [Vigna angularis]KAG2399135.1 uncharacterized protein HKW66_Vig0083830 [Vigna angularis]KOM40329.1 hypothetical protein LR48_Vigan04g052700 [Vigna angularis]BAT79552.1 hypothetical protein VIGAN_02245900 [Vigna angularis var. angularis]